MSEEQRQGQREEEEFSKADETSAQDDIKEATDQINQKDLTGSIENIHVHDFDYSSSVLQIYKDDLATRSKQNNLAITFNSIVIGLSLLGCVAAVVDFQTSLQFNVSNGSFFVFLVSLAIAITLLVWGIHVRTDYLAELGLCEKKLVLKSKSGRRTSKPTKLRKKSAAQNNPERQKKAETFWGLMEHRLTYTLTRYSVSLALLVTTSITFAINIDWCCESNKSTCNCTEFATEFLAKYDYQLSLIEDTNNQLVSFNSNFQSVDNSLSEGLVNVAARIDRASQEVSNVATQIENVSSEIASLELIVEGGKSFSEWIRSIARLIELLFGRSYGNGGGDGFWGSLPDWIGIISDWIRWTWGDSDGGQAVQIDARTEINGVKISIDKIADKIIDLSSINNDFSVSSRREKTDIANERKISQPAEVLLCPPCTCNCCTPYYPRCCNGSCHRQMRTKSRSK